MTCGVAVSKPTTSSMPASSKTAGPGRVSRYVLRAYFAIEATAGSFDRWEIGLGDVIEVRG